MDPTHLRRSLNHWRALAGSSLRDALYSSGAAACAGAVLRGKPRPSRAGAMRCTAAEAAAAEAVVDARDAAAAPVGVHVCLSVC